MAPQVKTSRPASDERGTTLVEFALLAPILFALFLGTVTGGLAYNRKLAITDAVRDGARFGATLNTDTTTYASWASAVQTRTVDLSAGELKAADVCVLLVKVDTSSGSRASLASSSGCSFAEPNDPSEVDDSCIVKVWAQRPAKIEAVLYSQTVTIKGDAVARYERIAGGACS